VVVTAVALGVVEVIVAAEHLNDAGDTCADAHEDGLHAFTTQVVKCRSRAACLFEARP
jgi:hypothetical protein